MFNTFRAGDPVVAMPHRLTDVTGRMKVSFHQNIYDADFEYGTQPLRWEAFLAGGGTVLHVPREGGVRLAVSTASGDVAIRQSRPYFRYQPGKTMAMSTAMLFGAATANNLQRVGFFDDGNGVFFQQGDPTGTNPSGMSVVVRSDVSGMPVDTVIPSNLWNGDRTRYVDALDWTRLQMLYIEYAWYGGGAIRWGVMINGDPIVLHTFGAGNQVGRTTPWARTGNLPVRYEMRNTGTIAAVSAATHYGVSVMVDGGVDDQRGFTYSYGHTPGARRTVPANQTRFPLMSLRMRPMGQISETNTATGGSTTTLVRTGAGWTVNQWQGMYLWTTGGTGAGQLARIVSNDATTLTLQNNIIGTALATALASGTTYQIGFPSRGQLLPRRLVVSSTALATVELIQQPTLITGVNWADMSTLGSANSFAQRDISGTATVGGEVVFAFTAPAGGSGIQDFDLSNLFPLFNNIRGSSPDILTVAITTPAGAASDLAAHIIAQEAMS